MDILIQLLVWLFRALFGEVEQPPDTSRGPRPAPPRRRGPYVYGDEPSVQGKTLEEILEDVRQAAAQKRSRIAAPEPPQPSRTTSTNFSVTGGLSEAPDSLSPPPRPTPPPVPSGSRAPRPAPRSRPPPVAPPAEPEAVRPAPEELVTLKASLPSIKESLVVLPPAPEPMSMTGAATGAEPLAPMSAVPEIMSPADAAAELAKSAAARPAGLPAGIVGFLNVILQATPEQKRDVARQAIVLHEVFGPPCCRRPHRAGSRAF